MNHLRSSCEAEAVASVGAVGDDEPAQCVGLDAEWTVHFVLGQAPEPISVLQVATRACAYLFLLRKIGMPDNLKRFLEDAKVSKAGFNMANDKSKLLKDMVWS